ncbi:MAG: hypothetical protein ABSG52_02355 [Terriglobales bacterium]|jgi:hypothetical protein
MSSQRALLRALMAAALMLTLLASGSAFAQEKPAAKPAEKPAAKPAEKPAATATPWAIQIEPVSAEEGKLPPDFAMAIYEKLIEEVGKTNKFQQVFRSGDRRATDVPNLLILTTTLEKFERGSQTKRAVTTVAGATKISVRAKLATRDSQIKADKTVQGTVRLFGENLKATQNLAKNIATLISQSSF